MKKPLYLTTAPPPPVPGTDAMFQDIARLQSRFGGERLDLYPFKRPCALWPHALMGWHLLPRLRRALAEAAFGHVFGATLAPLPCLAWCRTPLIYTAAACVGNGAMRGLCKHTAVAVSAEADLSELRRAGFTNVRFIRPGIETEKFSFSHPPAPPPFILLAGSAPWTLRQFRTKGVELLLQSAAAARGALRILFLWRNLPVEQLLVRARKAGAEPHIEILEAPADVNAALARCHAAVVLAENERLVKAWPHSAIEALAAGKPAILSAAIAMSEYLEQNQAGVRVETFNAEGLEKALNRIQTEYAARSGPRLQELARRDFAAAAMLDAYAELYAAICPPAV